MSPTQQSLRDHLQHLDDDALLRSLRANVARLREALAGLLLHLGEVDARRLYAERGHPSLFAWCVSTLGFSEGATYRRIRAARLGRRFPLALDLVARGELHLSSLSTLAPHLTDENHPELLCAAKGLRREELERMLAARNPKPDVPDSVRKLPTPKRAIVTAAPALAPAQVPAPESAPTPRSPQPRPEPLTADRYKVTFTASRSVVDKLAACKDLLAHAGPDGDTAQVVERALDALHAELLKRKRGAAKPPKPTKSTAAEPATEAGRRSRHIPTEVRRVVWERDGGQCTYVGSDGPCGARRFIEFHHQTPFARGGKHTADGLALMCRRHNEVLARREFGDAHMDRFTQGTLQLAPGRAP